MMSLRYICRLHCTGITYRVHLYSALNSSARYHIWIPLLNQHCPTPKRFNPPFTQNPFCNLERILSHNWWNFFSIDLKSPQCKKKKGILKTNKSDTDFQVWTKTPRTQPQKQCINFFTKSFFSPQNSWSCPQAYRGAGCRRKSPLDGATNFILKIWRHIMTVSFVSALIFVFARNPKKPLDMSKWAPKSQQEPKIYLKPESANYRWHWLNLADSGWLLLTLADSNRLWRTARVRHSQLESDIVSQSHHK